jgi:spore maturation protein CgeB
MNGEAPSHDVVFVGTGFDSRVALLCQVDWTGIDLGLYGAWGELPADHPLAPYVRPGLVSNARAGALYRKARIGLNLYRSAGGVPAESLNPRAYELAADGVFTLSQPRREVGEKFCVDVATFRDAAELQASVRRYVTDPWLCGLSAGRLPALVAEDTYHHRAAQLVAHLK